MEKTLKEVNFGWCDTCKKNDRNDIYGEKPICDECLRYPYNENSEVPFNYDGPRPDKCNKCPPYIPKEAKRCDVCKRGKKK